MDPVEPRPLPVVGRAPEEGDQRLHEAEAGGDAAQDGVGVLLNGDVGPAVQLGEDQDEAGWKRRVC